jgi:hypothetical protein
MKRRDDPRLVYEAQKAHLHRRLVDEVRIDELEASHWIEHWERHAATADVAKGGDVFWEEGWHWITTARGARKGSPKTDMGAEGDDGQVFGG